MEVPHLDGPVHSSGGEQGLVRVEGPGSDPVGDGLRQDIRCVRTHPTVHLISGERVPLGDDRSRTARDYLGDVKNLKQGMN